MKQVQAQITHKKKSYQFPIEYDGKWTTLRKICQREMSNRNIKNIDICDGTYYYTIKKIEDVKKDELIRIKDTPIAPVYIRGEYSRMDYPPGQGRYCCTKYDDINADRYLKKGTLVAVDFDY